MLMHPDQAGKNCVAGQIDLADSFRNWNGARRSKSCNLAMVEQQRLIGPFRRAGPVDYADVGKRDNRVAERHERLNTRF